MDYAPRSTRSDLLLGLIVLAESVPAIRYRNLAIWFDRGFYPMSLAFIGGLHVSDHVFFRIVIFVVEQGQMHLPDPLKSLNFGDLVVRCFVLETLPWAVVYDHNLRLDAPDVRRST